MSIFGSIGGGLNQITSHVLTKYKADTSEQKAAIKSLRGEEKKAAKERLAELESQNKGIDEQIAKWAKIGAGVAGMAGTFEILRESVKSYAEYQSRLTAAAGADMRRLQADTQGLVSEMDLLTDAAKLQHGAWALNSKQMDTVLHGAVAIRHEMGGQLQPIIDKLTEAIGQGQTGEIARYGVTGKTLNEVLAQLDRKWRDLHGSTGLASDGIERAGVAVTNSTQHIKNSLGELVTALGPAIEKLAQFLDLVAAALHGKHTSLSMNFTDTFFSGGFYGDVAEATRQALANQGGRKLIASGGYETTAADIAATKQLRALNDQISAEVAYGIFIEAGKILAPYRKHGGGVDVTGGFGMVPGTAPKPPPPLTGIGGDLGGPGAIPGVDTSHLGPDGFKALGDMWEQASGAAAQFQALLDQAGHKSMVEAIFGPTDHLVAYKDAFNALEGAVTGAFKSWIEGSGSVGDAVKAAIAQGIEAVAIDASIQALKETAYGIASLALGPLGGVSASGHFAAAAAFGGVAAAAGLAAHELWPHLMGHPAASGSIGAGAGGGSYGYVSEYQLEHGSGSETKVINLGMGWDNSTPRERQRQLQIAIRRSSRFQGSHNVRDHR